MVQLHRKLAFYYVDLVGSTSFKYTGDTDRWMTLFRSFYFDFPEILTRERNRFSQLNGLDLVPLNYWKGLGDAVIYSTRYRDPDELFAQTTVFYNAFLEYDGYLHRRFGIKLKGACWDSCLPGTTLEVDTPTGRDYIGPDMDLGFRLAQEAVPGRLLTAMDLCYALTQSSRQGSMRIHHVGWRKLKGIHRDTPYPIFQFSNDQVPQLRIWDAYLCDLTEGYLQSKPLGPEALRSLIEQYKEELRFRPEVV